MQASSPLKCRGCGAFGKGVVRHNHMCAHCNRTTRALFDPSVDPYCGQGYVDVSPDGDGGVLKKLLREGTGGGIPESGCPCNVHYVGRKAGGDIFETTREEIDGKLVGGTDDPFEFKPCHGEVPLGWDIAILTMTQGELAQFVLRPQYAYGDAGYEPKVGPAETILLELELLSVDPNPLPKPPSEAEVAASRQAREEEERRRQQEQPEPTILERIETAMREREAGNALFARGDYEGAQKQYDTAFVHIFVTQDAWDELLTEEEREALRQARRTLHLNRAIAKIKGGKPDEALWDCDKALELDPGNAKGLYRRAVVRVEQLTQLLKKEGRREFWDPDKAWQLEGLARQDIVACLAAPESDASAARKLQGRLDRLKEYLEMCMRRYHAQQKRFFRENVFARLESEARGKAAAHAAEASASDATLAGDVAQAGEFDDLPPLEE